MIKLYGFALLITAGIFFGYIMRDKGKKRIKILSGFLKSLDYIIPGISVSNMTVPGLLSELSARGEETDLFFSVVNRESESGKGMGSGFERAVSECDIKKEDVFLFEGLKECLYTGEKSLQLEALKNLREEASKSLDIAREEEKRRMKYESAMAVSAFAVLGSVLL